MTHAGAQLNSTSEDRNSSSQQRSLLLSGARSPTQSLLDAACSTAPSRLCAGSAHRILLRIADLHPQNMVQEPVDGLVPVEHEDELHNDAQVQ